MTLVKVEIGAKEAMERFIGHIPVIVEDENTGKWFRIYGKDFPLKDSSTKAKAKNFKPIPIKARREEYMKEMGRVKKHFGEWAKIKFYRHELQEDEIVVA